MLFLSFEANLQLKYHNIFSWFTGKKGKGFLIKKFLIKTKTQWIKNTIFDGCCDGDERLRSSQH